MRVAASTLGAVLVWALAALAVARVVQLRREDGFLKPPGVSTTDWRFTMMVSIVGALVIAVVLAVLGGLFGMLASVPGGILFGGFTMLMGLRDLSLDTQRSESA